MGMVVHKFIGYDEFYGDYACYDSYTDCNYQWNPRERKQDAFALMSDLMLSIDNGIHIEIAQDIFGGEYAQGVEVWWVHPSGIIKAQELYYTNKIDAICKAILRVAAEIGSKLK